MNGLSSNAPPPRNTTTSVSTFTPDCTIVPMIFSSTHACTSLIMELFTFSDNSVFFPSKTFSMSVALTVILCSSLIVEIICLYIHIIPTFSVVMVRKNILENLDFNAPYKPSLDWYLWLQLVGKYQFYYVNQKLTNWRIHKTSYAHKRINNFFGAALFEYKKNVILKEKFAGLKFILDIITCIRKYLIRIVLKKNYFRLDILNFTVFEKTKCKEDK